MSKKSVSNINNKEIYLDNNSITPIDPKVADLICQWLPLARNPSTNSKSAEKSIEAIELARSTLLDHCGCPKNNKSVDAYSVIFTSGASESNCLILRSVALAYRRLQNNIPHLIVSAIEHESIMSCCRSLEEDKLATVSYIMPNIEGSIPLYSIEKAILPNTALISIMFANNEIGTINNIRDIGALAHSYKIPYHTDATQTFGKYTIRLSANNIDAISFTFYKFNGPMGLGALILRNELITAYSLNGQISGTQQMHLRGGTENVPAIACIPMLMKNTFKDRELKNQKLFQLRAKFIDGLSKIYPIGDYAKYLKQAMTDEVDDYNIEYDPANQGFTDGLDTNLSNLQKTSKSKSKSKSISKKIISAKDSLNVSGTVVGDFNPVEIVIFGPEREKKARYLPNTILFSVVKNQIDSKGFFCNINLKKDLAKKNIVVSISSACNTSSNEISHVLKALMMPKNVGRGVIRVSMGDQTSTSDIDFLLLNLKECIAKQIA